MVPKEVLQPSFEDQEASDPGIPSETPSLLLERAEANERRSMPSVVIDPESVDELTGAAPGSIAAAVHQPIRGSGTAGRLTRSRLWRPDLANVGPGNSRSNSSVPEGVVFPLCPQRRQGANLLSSLMPPNEFPKAARAGGSERVHRSSTRGHRGANAHLGNSCDGNHGVPRFEAAGPDRLDAEV